MVECEDMCCMWIAAIQATFGQWYSNYLLSLRVSFFSYVDMVQFKRMRYSHQVRISGTSLKPT